MGNVKNPHNNQSGCSDPTAYEGLKSAIENENQLEKRVHFLLKVLKYIIGANGFMLISRIELRDEKTGREFR
ncbi:MAG: hypothetical protein RSC99_09840 [Clostridiales bacterium]